MNGAFITSDSNRGGLHFHGKGGWGQMSVAKLIGRGTCFKGDKDKSPVIVQIKVGKRYSTDERLSSG